MVTLVPMGYGVTDENGVAKLDHDMDGNVLSHSYTGVGAGRIDLLASIDDPDNVSYSGEGTLVSETYEVLDCEWYDDCLPNTHNTNWFNRNGLSTEYSSNGLKLTSGANSGNYMPNKDGTATSITDVTEWSPSFALELDIVDFDNNSYSNIGMGAPYGGTVGRSLNQLGITGATHLKITYDGSTVKYYKDNSTTETYSASLTSNPVYISIGVSQGHYITIKDVKIYPI